MPIMKRALDITWVSCLFNFGLHSEIFIFDHYNIKYYNLKLLQFFLHVNFKMKI